MNHQQSPREASGDCCCISGLAAQNIHLIFPPLPKDKAEPNIALKINIHWGRASRILINVCGARRGVPKILGMQVVALSPSAINYPQLILAESALGRSAVQGTAMERAGRQWEDSPWKQQDTPSSSSSQCSHPSVHGKEEWSTGCAGPPQPHSEPHLKRLEGVRIK